MCISMYIYMCIFIIGNDEDNEQNHKLLINLLEEFRVKLPLLKTLYLGGNSFSNLESIYNNRIY